MFSQKFIKDAEGLSTFAQVVLALLLVAGPVGIQVINWLHVVSVGALAAVISLFPEERGCHQGR
jgi:Putative lactococcus lactis phage r1t holin